MTRLIKLLYGILIFFTPLIFTSNTSELFELPKMYFVYAVTLAVLCFHLANFLKGKSLLFRHTPLDIWLIIFLISQIISTVFSIDFYTSFFGYYSRLNGGLLSLVAYLILYWILAVYIDDRLRRNLINFSLLSGILVAAYAIGQHFGIDKDLWVQDVQSRVFSTFGQPNWLAAYLCILLPLTLYRLFLSSGFLPTTGYQLIIAIFYLALLFTKSKSGLAAALFTIAPLLILDFIFSTNPNPSLRGVIDAAITLPRRLVDRHPRSGGVAMAHFFSSILNPKSYIIYLLLVLTLLIDNPIKDRLLPSPSSPSNPPQSQLITPSSDIRKIVWQGALDLWRRFPLIGTGVETFAYSYYWTRPVTHNLTSEWDFLYNKAHNEYLNYLATTGAIGLLAYTLLIIFIIKELLPHRFFLAAFVSILISNFFGFSTVITSLFFLLLPALALRQRTSAPAHQRTILLPLPFVLLAFLLYRLLGFYLADICYAQALRLDQVADYSQAYQQINLALGYRPQEPNYLMKKADLAAKLALTTANSQYFDVVIDTSSKALSLSPVNVNFWIEATQDYFLISTVDSSYFQLAAQAADKTITLAPTDAKARYLAAVLWQASNDLDKAASYYQKAIELKPNYDHALFQLAQIYIKQKKHDLARPLLEQTLLYAPNNTDAQKLLEELI